MLKTRFNAKKWGLFSILLAFSHTISASPLCPTNAALSELALQTAANTPRLIGLSIAITHPVCGTFNFTYGKANLATAQPMDANTELAIASNTKPILIVLAFLIMEAYPEKFPEGIYTKLTDIRDNNGLLIFTADGKINTTNGGQIDLVDADFFKLRTGKSYDCKRDTIYQCPNFAEIDLHHLLLESSGLADYIRETDLSHDNVPEMLKFAFSKLFSRAEDPGSKEFQTDVEALKTFGVVKKNNPDPIVPAQSHNTDASLLAIILERVSDQSLNALLTQHILTPLKLPANSMRFVTQTADITSSSARRYALLNTDEEIEKAIAESNLLPTISAPLARQFKPSFLSRLGRKLYTLDKKELAIDVLDLHGQGIFAFPGPGGIIAAPKDYIQFYQALASGKLLSPKSQALFNASFIPVSHKTYRLSTGYGSNDKTEWMHTEKRPTFLSHGGFVPGGESSVLYHYQTGLTIMVATNTSGNWRNTLPLLFVTPTAYLDKNAIWDLEMKYATLFNVF